MLIRVYVVRLITRYITEYKIISDSAITCDFIRSASECESAANELGLSDLSATKPTSVGTYRPPFCHIVNERLYFSHANTGHCSANSKCICKQNDFCAKSPCREGQGDCDSDSECEGSLVCGRMNCMNKTIADCCTKPCDSDLDCTNQECSSDIHQCRLDSYSTKWSMCSQDSQCVDGEGDCDEHSDCEGSLLCGSDNCARGPNGMDCCTDDGIVICYF